MSEAEVRYTDDDYDVVLEVRQASFADGLRRIALQQEQGESKMDTIAERIRAYGRQSIFPACVSSTKIIANNGKKKLVIPETYEEFEKLPDTLVDIWITAVWEKNPHWSPFGLLKALSNSSTENSSGGTDPKQTE